MKSRAGWLAVVSVVALTASCGRSSSGRAAKSSEPADRPDDAGHTGDASRAAEGALAGPIPEKSRQLIVGVAESWRARAVELFVFERPAYGQPWAPAGEGWPGTLGRGGLSWGRGLHGDGAPAGQDGPEKREGDRTSPAGVFALTRAYGYAERGRGLMPYVGVSRSWRCIDDPESASYNLVLDSADLPAGSRDWSSAERMRRNDGLYEWVIEIAHNLPARQSGSGSCIFFHVWRKPGAPTIGCTAMTKDRIQDLLDVLDPAALPVYVLLPKDTYGALRHRWHLPELK